MINDIEVKKSNLAFPSADGRTRIHAVCWAPSVTPVGVLQLVHGMVEYIERYDTFARYMAGKGFLVVGHDHLGHGRSVCSVEDWGYISDKNPADIMIRDIHRLRSGISRKYPDTPYFILGHSMGSYLVRRYLSYKGDGLAGAIIVGTGYESKAATAGGLMLVRSMTLKEGARHRSDTIKNMTYTAPYKMYDLNGIDNSNSWVCSDSEIMAAYNSDARCQFTFTLSGYEALLSTVQFTGQTKNIDMIPKSLPILLASGELDPVGNLGKGVKTVYKKYVESGITDIECKLYPNDRHEILNEPDRETVFADMYDWISRHLDTV